MAAGVTDVEVAAEDGGPAAFDVQESLPLPALIEVNPRASRTVPFVSKATAVPFAKIAALVMAGKKLVDLGVTEEAVISHIAVKEPVFPFNRFPGSDIILGPEMRSTGEVH